MDSKRITFRSRLRSIGFAWDGIKYMFREEPNIRIHTVATLIAVVSGIICEISTLKWIALVFAIALVWVAETINTSIEKISDYVCNNQYDSRIATIKDTAAAAVLLASVFSVVIALFVFIEI